MTAAPASQIATQEHATQVAELLAQMHGILAPAEVGWWPPAIGWWILPFVILAILALIVKALIGKRKRSAYRREALGLLVSLTPQNNATYASEVSSLLKRTAFSAHPECKTEITQACGDQWVKWLNEHSTEAYFSGASYQALALGIYQANAQVDAIALQQSAQRWIEHHV